MSEIEKSKPVVERRLVRPRRETVAWKRLGEELDGIRNNAEEAIDIGFVRGNTKALDEAMRKIEAKVRRVRASLRPNAYSPDPS
jgi:hypothetical protein